MPARPPRSQPSYEDEKDRDLPAPPPQQYQQGRPGLGGGTVSFSDASLPPRSSSYPHPQSNKSYTKQPIPSAYNNHSLDNEDAELPTEQLPYGFAPNGDGLGGAGGSDFRRKKSLVRPERERVDPGDRLFHYRQHAAQMEEQG